MCYRHRHVPSRRLCLSLLLLFATGCCLSVQADIIGGLGNQLPSPIKDQFTQLVETLKSHLENLNVAINGSKFDQSVIIQALLDLNQKLLQRLQDVKLFSNLPSLLAQIISWLNIITIAPSSEAPELSPNIEAATKAATGLLTFIKTNMGSLAAIF